MANEKRLIDVCAEIRKIDECLAKRKEQADYLTYRIFEAVKTALEKAPTVDAVEVKHGRWEEHPRDTFAKEHRCEKLRCTHCCHFFYHNYGDNKLYCPNCGAKMD
jgi:uncharacterized paraquat-inducible protein A